MEKRQLKIGVLNDTFVKGRGADHVIFELARRLGKKNNVEVIANLTEFPEENFKIKKLKGEKLLTGTWKDFLGFSKFFKYRKLADEFDIINLHHTTLTFAFLGKKNVIITYHGSPSKIEDKGLRKIFRTLANDINKFLLKYMPKIIAISESAKKELLKKGVPERKIEIIYDGVDDKFKPLKKEIDKGYILYIGRHVPHKCIEELIQISCELKIPLKIGGDGPDTNKLKEYAEKLNAKVEFLGKVSEKEKIKLYRECSVFVSASKWEGFGLIFLEAGACGKPCLAYRICSIPEVIEHKKTGFLAENFQEFKKYLEILMKNKRLRKKMGKEAINFSRRFNWDIITNKYEKLLKTYNS